MIGIDGYIWIGEEYLEPQSALTRIRERDSKRSSRRETLACKLPMDPVEEGVDVRFTVS